MGGTARHPAARLADLALLAWLGVGLALLLLVGLTQTALAKGFGAWRSAPQDAALLFGLYLGLSLPLGLALRRLWARARGEAPRPRSRRQELALSGGVAAGTLAWILLCCELAAAAVTHPVAFGLQSDPVLNHVWEPNASHEHILPLLGDPRFNTPFTITTNGMSWREDREVPRAKPPGTYRVFYVGDSFTAGACDAEASVPRLVERALNAASADPAVRIEVVNTGTASYSPLIYATLVRRVLVDFAPDLIVINVDMTDVFDDWKYHKWTVYDPQGDPLAVAPRDVAGDGFVETGQGVVGITPWLRLKLFLYHRSRLYGYLIRRFGTKRASGDAQAGARSRWGWCQDPWTPEVEANVRRSLGVLERLAGWCRARGIKLAWTGVPHHRQFGDARGPRWSSRPHRALGEAAERAGVPYLDSFAALRGEMRGTPQDRYYYRHDMHFNPAGNALWAKAQVAFLSDRAHGLLPEGWYR